ncbi:hypothetical protein BKA58DRAFT_367455 [Alternaria rosae]|uniref:uncharacterized protein n=1 Tax=Alternaria rosae TaxID=1187941 RepID=UPI001E8DC932|nr:uncharacterized protein BKA58DRAFT_367455 [Alternaria rosae]KAH6865295.1 hypothetical protein BKA58DRAFT_367455 [Alternaria rosae]
MRTKPQAAIIAREEGSWSTKAPTDPKKPLEPGQLRHTSPPTTDITITQHLHSESGYSPVPLLVGDLFICSLEQVKGCWILHTLNKCLDLPSQIAYNAKYIEQSKGSFCKYYRKTGCMDGDEFWRHTSGPKDVSQIAGDGIKHLASAWCGGTGVTSEMEVCRATGATAQINAVADGDGIEKVNNVGSLIYTVDGRTTKRDWPPGSTTVCHQTHYQSCTDNRINAIQQCANFATADQGPVSIIQYGGAYCKWYRDFGCEGGEDKSPMSIDSMAAKQWVDDLGEEDRFKSVKCETYQW